MKSSEMMKLDEEERELLQAFERGELVSVTTEAELQRFRAAARATGVKSKRVGQ